MNVLCIGFFGHGNVGDEAMAKSWNRYLVRPFENTYIRYATEASPDALAKINNENPFYAQNRQIISVHDTEAVSHFDVIIVGGGQLSPVYGIPMVLRAKVLKKSSYIARIGSSVRDDFLRAGNKVVALAKSSIDLFDFISVRDRMGFDAFAAMGFSPHIGADVAINFPVDDRTDIGLKAPYVVIAVREVRYHDIARQVQIVKSVLEEGRQNLEQHAPHIYLLPFCEPDQRFLDENALTFPGVDVLRDVWKSPERVAAIVSRASFLLSVGRLHPLIFAFSNRVPCVGITYRDTHAEAVRLSPSTYNKMLGFMDSAGLAHRSVDWDTPLPLINHTISDAFRTRDIDRGIMDQNGGVLKRRMLESLVPVWKAMGATHGLGLERGLRKGEFRVDDYDDSYMHGVRVYKNGDEFAIWEPPRLDWDGWNIVANLMMSTIAPKSVIDIGCGRGFFLKRMVARGIPAQGLECSQAAWEDAPVEVKDKIRVARIDEVSHVHDVVTAFDVMEHIYEEDIPDFIGHMKRIAGRYIVLNICASPEGGPVLTIKRDQPIPDDLEWLAVSGHVTIRHRSWWKERFEDANWVSDETTAETWLRSLGFPAWEKQNILIIRRR